MLTAFSVNDVHGLGLIEEPRKVIRNGYINNCKIYMMQIWEERFTFLQLKVFRPFFISMDLPYSVIRGEIVAIQIVVFNYMNKNVMAEVLLTNEGQFDFAEMSNEVQDVPSRIKL